MLKRLSILFISVILAGCTFFQGMYPSYRVGVDPNFYPADLGDQGERVVGFTKDLFQAVSSIEHVNLDVVLTGTQTLWTGLRKGSFDAIVSSERAVGFQKDVILTSNPYLLTGPVIVVRKDSQIDSLKKLKKKEVGIMHNSDAIFVLEKDPSIVIRLFKSEALAFQALEHKKVDALAIDSLVAYAYCKNIYNGSLKVSSAPLTKEGLRLVTLKSSDNKLVSKFNKAIKSLRRKSVVKTLQEKWQIN